MKDSRGLDGRLARAGGLYALILMAAVLGAISLDAAPAETLRLRVSSLAPAGATEPAAVSDLRVQQEFLQRNPGIELVAAEGIRIEGTVSEVTTVMMVTGGIAPDVINMNFRSTDSFVRQGIVAPLEPFLDAETPEERERLLSRIPSQVLPVVNRVGPEGQRHLFGLPRNLMFSGIFLTAISSIKPACRSGLPEIGRNSSSFAVNSRPWARK